MQKIILADFDAEYCRATAEALNAAEGVHVAGTTDQGGRVLPLLRETGANVLVTELALRDMDGLEVIRRVRAELGPAVRVVVYSGVTERRLVARAWELGADAYVVKPVTVERLVGWIR